MPLAAVAGIGLAGSIASGVIGANAAGHAADTQAAAANNAAQLERQSATDALNFNKLQYGNSLSLLSPFYNTGVAANSRLAYLMGLNPAQGLPAGVVNPNTQTPASTSGFGVSLPNGDFGGDVALPAANGNRFSMLAAGGDGAIASPFTGGPRGAMAFGGGQNNAGITPSGAIIANGSPGMVPRTDGGATPDAFPGNPDAHNFGASGPNSFGSLAQGWNQTFQSPDAVTEQNDPGYQFRLQQGQLALQNSAAARGGLLTGGTAKALDDYNQNAASNEYQNVYNRALQNYNTNYNTFTNDQTNEFNRLMALQNGGQVSGQNLSASGITAANNAANIGLTSAGQIGQQLNNAGAATASGYIGGANAITGAINNGTNSLSTLALLQMLKQNPAGAGGLGV